ncbi:Type 1 glutamine amidotransferase-like domain-containing protein [Propionibacterium australiense]|uniref:Peptidase E n=1 Tax=Propionibacterium australiense TaxID=119981 RepID=A0A383S6B4_9ACTN|nr:peptidase E [Propionibacterium australiense]RLP10604.1 peptidase E [Propionibacterium australiense]RLP12900.1 peptidase E [Propionibacterium australiense]SYZ32806.1 Peptidase family S51 [Propionibacterium australiense]VEH91214.1 Peptidase E [Propionibacterium australiense]
MSTHIVAMGGGGFSMSSNGAPTSLDRYIVDLADKSAPLVCFAPTASADNATYINRFLMAYSGLGVRTMVLTLWQGAAESVRRLPEADVVLVGGGNTANLMALWDAHGVSSVLRRMAEENGRTTVLGGISAGAACWFEGCLTDAFGDLRGWRGGLGLLPGSFCPHLDGEDRGAVYTQAVASGMIAGGYGVDDGAALHFIDGQLSRVVAEREGVRALHVVPSDEPTASGVLTEVLTPELL